MTDYPLTKANRLRLARAFARSKRVDLSIDCVIEGQMGRAFADDPEHPTAFMIQTGPFCYFAGNAQSRPAQDTIRDLPPYSFLMPSPPEWVEAAKRIHGKKLIERRRYSFSSQDLSIDHLDGILRESPFGGSVRRIDAALAAEAWCAEDSFLDISDYDSPEDFAERGVGFCMMDDRSMMGAAFSSLVCSKGIEVSIFVMPEHRRKGVATALACSLVTWCLAANADPHWDAANPESCALAEKLGYAPAGSYTAHFLVE